MVLQAHPFFGRYQIDSESGDVHSSYSNKILTPRPDTSGHLQVALYLDGEPHRRHVHHLVLETFVGFRPAGMKGLHYDDDPLNNHVDNLYWGTSSQNSRDAVRNGRHAHARKTECKRGHLLAAPNLGKSVGRACLACNRANALANYRGIKDEGYRQVLADQKFAEIMKAAG